MAQTIAIERVDHIGIRVRDLDRGHQQLAAAGRGGHRRTHVGMIRHGDTETRRT